MNFGGSESVLPEKFTGDGGCNDLFGLWRKFGHGGKFL